MSVRAILFDLDDTLVKTASIKWAHHKAVAKRFYNVELTDEALAKYWGMPLVPMMSLLYQSSDTPENLLKANLSLEAEFPKALQPDSLAIVERLLEAGMQLGVVTSTLGDLARRDLERLGFPLARFLFVHGADDSPAHKPDPRVFDPALALLRAKGIDPSEALYVGDALIDHRAARGAGIGFLGVATGFVTIEEFERAGARAVGSLRAVLSELPGVR